MVRWSVDGSDVWCHNFIMRQDEELLFGGDIDLTLESNSTNFHGETPYQSEVTGQTVIVVYQTVDIELTHY